MSLKYIKQLSVPKGMTIEIPIIIDPNSNTHPTAPSLLSHCTFTLLDCFFSTPSIVPKRFWCNLCLHRAPIRNPLSTPPNIAKTGHT